MALKLSLCSEVFDTPIEETIERVAKLGFDGIEIAPFKIAERVEDIPSERRRAIREAAARAGIEIVGLHWLLVSPEGLHLTTADPSVRERTVAYLGELARFCGDLGGRVMVLGSPQQRSLEAGTTREQAFERAAAGLRKVSEACAEAGVKLLIEPLNPTETDFIQTVEEAIELRDAIDHPATGYIVDCKAMSGMPLGIEGTIRRFAREAGHFHANEPSGKGPGMGDVDFRPILSALRESGYQGWVSTEPFQYEPDPETVARAAIETLREAAASTS